MSWERGREFRQICTQDWNNSNREERAIKPGVLNSHPHPIPRSQGHSEIFFAALVLVFSLVRWQASSSRPLRPNVIHLSLCSLQIWAVWLRNRALEFCGQSDPDSHRVLKDSWQHAQKTWALLSRLPRWKWMRPSAAHATFREDWTKPAACQPGALSCSILVYWANVAFLTQCPQVLAMCWH